jgi:hypothetical protein
MKFVGLFRATATAACLLSSGPASAICAVDASGGEACMEYNGVVAEVAKEPDGEDRIVPIARNGSPGVKANVTGTPKVEPTSIHRAERPIPRRTSTVDLDGRQTIRHPDGATTSPRRRDHKTRN